MREKTIYLCGPIQNCTDEECNDWRERVTGLWSGKVLDPMRRDYRGKQAEHYRDIVELDKIDVAASDALVVNYTRPSVGTSMEILYAWQMGKLVVVVVPDMGMELSPWLRYHAHRIVGSYAEAVTVLERWLV